MVTRQDIFIMADGDMGSKEYFETEESAIRKGIELKVTPWRHTVINDEHKGIRHQMEKYSYANERWEMV